MLKAKQIRALTHGMSAALLNGPWVADAMNARLADALGRPWRWRRSVVRRLLAQHASAPPYEGLSDAIAADPDFVKAVHNRTRPRIVHWVPRSASSLPAFPDWNLPTIDTMAALGQRLELTYSQLCWLADGEQRQGRPDEGLRQHYRRYWLRKPAGGWRLVEEPRYRLKLAQRRILHDILDRIAPHPAACAFHHSRSILDFAGAHAGKSMVLHLDLKHFFPSIPASRLHAMFATLGYPPAVARLMTGLCTSVVPLGVCRRHADGLLYSAPHLPQGAPTSPALANLAAFRLDGRLTGAAASVGATYTRYADDLAFSGDGDFARGITRFQSLVWRIVHEEGFEIHHRKTRVMHRGVRQRLCGLVVNDHLNIDRRTYDRLKATLTNCVRHGLEAQNRARHPHFLEHLRGRVAYVEQVAPLRGARLRAIFNAIPAA